MLKKIPGGLRYMPVEKIDGFWNNEHFSVGSFSLKEFLEAAIKDKEQIYINLHSGETIAGVPVWVGENDIVRVERREQGKDLMDAFIPISEISFIEVIAYKVVQG
jgi:hypothetical protein